MKAQNKAGLLFRSKLKRISFSPDVDILTIQLSDKKLDDSYDIDDMIVQVDKNGEPVIIEMFNGRKHLEELGKTLPKDIKQNFTKQFAAVSHQIRK